MEIRPHRIIERKKTKKIKVGNVYIGGDSPISVQSMTNTITSNETSTIHQIKGESECGNTMWNNTMYSKVFQVCIHSKTISTWWEF